MFASLSTENANRSPRELLEQAKAWSSRLFGKALSESGVSMSQASRVLGVSTQLIARMADPDDAYKNLRVADLACMPPFVMRYVLDRLAEVVGCKLVEVCAYDGDNADLRTIATAHQQATEAITAALVAVADGHFGVEEAAVVEREAGEALPALVALRDLARSVIAERGKVIER